MGSFFASSRMKHCMYSVETLVLSIRQSKLLKSRAKTSANAIQIRLISVATESTYLPRSRCFSLY